MTTKCKFKVGDTVRHVSRPLTPYGTIFKGILTIKRIDPCEHIHGSWTCYFEGFPSNHGCTDKLLEHAQYPSTIEFWESISE